MKKAKEASPVSQAKQSETSKTESTIILEELEEDYEPTEEEIQEYATYLGMDLKDDSELLWIAKEGLKAPVPKPWKPCRTPKGNIYYFNFETGQSSWEHPSDQDYKKLYQKEKEKKEAKQKDFNLKLSKEIKNMQEEIKEEVEAVKTERNRELFQFKAKLLKELENYDKELEQETKDKIKQFRIELKSDMKKREIQYKKQCKDKLGEKVNKLKEEAQVRYYDELRKTSKKHEKQLEDARTEMHEKFKTKEESLKIRHKLLVESAINDINKERIEQEKVAISQELEIKLLEEVKNYENEQRTTLENYKNSLNQEKSKFALQLKEDMQSIVTKQAEQAKAERMQKSVFIQTYMLKRKEALTEKYVDNAREANIKHNSRVLQMYNQLDSQSNFRKTQLFQKHEFGLERLKAEARMELLGLEREIREEEGEFKVNCDAQLIKEIEEVEAEFNEKVRKATVDMNKGINEVKEKRKIVEDMMQIRRNASKVQEEIDQKRKEREMVQEHLELVMHEYNQVLKTVPTMQLEDLEQKEPKIFTKNEENIDALKQELNEKEAELEKLQVVPLANFEKQVLTSLTEIKKNMSPLKEARRKNTHLPATFDIAATLVVESEINSLKMKEIFVATFNEKMELAKLEQNLLDEYTNLVKLMGLLQCNDAEWRRQVERTSLAEKNKAALGKGFTRQSQQLEYQLRVIAYFL